MPWTNFHSHTYLCDGQKNVKDYIKEAIKQNMPSYGISGHAPVSFKTDWCIPDDNLKQYLKEVHEMKSDYREDIEVYLGLEIDFIPGIAGRSRHILQDIELDYSIGSIHFVDAFEDGTPWNIDHNRDFFLKGLHKIYNNNFLKAAERFYTVSLQMIEEDKPDIIGHLDKIKMYNKNNDLFNERDPEYRKYITEVLNQIKKTDTIVEVNTRGYYRYGQTDLYPSSWILEIIKQKDIPIMLNSDSHHPDEISSGFEYAAKKLKEIGIKELWIFLDKKWQSFSFSEQGLQL
jgi:histidinol-phosphatase (PHP family)